MHGRTVESFQAFMPWALILFRNYFSDILSADIAITLDTLAPQQPTDTEKLFLDLIMEEEGKVEKKDNCPGTNGRPTKEKRKTVRKESRKGGSGDGVAMAQASSNLAPGTANLRHGETIQDFRDPRTPSGEEK